MICIGALLFVDWKFERQRRRRLHAKHLDWTSPESRAGKVLDKVRDPKVTGGDVHSFIYS